MKLRRAARDAIKLLNSQLQCPVLVGLAGVGTLTARAVRPFNRAAFLAAIALLVITLFVAFLLMLPVATAIGSLVPLLAA